MSKENTAKVVAGVAVLLLILYYWNKPTGKLGPPYSTINANKPLKANETINARPHPS